MAIWGDLNLMKRIIPETQFDIEVTVKPQRNLDGLQIQLQWFWALPSYPKM